MRFPNPVSSDPLPCLPLPGMSSLRRIGAESGPGSGRGSCRPRRLAEIRSGSLDRIDRRPRRIDSSSFVPFTAPGRRGGRMEQRSPTSARLTSGSAVSSREQSRRSLADDEVQRIVDHARARARATPLRSLTPGVCRQSPPASRQTFDRRLPRMQSAHGVAPDSRSERTGGGCARRRPRSRCRGRSRRRRRSEPGSRRRCMRSRQALRGSTACRWRRPAERAGRRLRRSCRPPRSQPSQARTRHRCHASDMENVPFPDTVARPPDHAGRAMWFVPLASGAAMAPVLHRYPGDQSERNRFRRWREAPGRLAGDFLRSHSGCGCRRPCHAKSMPTGRGSTNGMG